MEITLTSDISERPLFSPGRVIVTPLAVGAILARYDEDSTQIALGFLIRHLGGDWAGLDAEDRDANHRAVQHGARVLSVFHMEPFPSEAENGQQGEAIWIITEANRTETTILLPEEY